MKRQTHILNGDALLLQLPRQILGDKIVMRECLMDGELVGKNLQEFYQNRIKFLDNYFDVDSSHKYYTEIVPEFEKIQQLNNTSEINLWFEDDLFCQVNMWFVTHLLSQNIQSKSVYLVRPNSGNEYSFGAMQTTELTLALENRILINTTELEKLASLWIDFKTKNHLNLLKTAKELNKRFPFLLQAIEAHIQRNLDNTNPGRPEKTLKQIVSDLKTTDFAAVFREFCKREAVYGFGDLQVKKMLDIIIENDNKNGK